MTEMAKLLKIVKKTVTSVRVSLPLAPVLCREPHPRGPVVVQVEAMVQGEGVWTKLCAEEIGSLARQKLPVPPPPLHRVPYDKVRKPLRHLATISSKLSK